MRVTPAYRRAQRQQRQKKLHAKKTEQKQLKALRSSIAKHVETGKARSRGVKRVHEANETSLKQHENKRKKIN